MCIGCLMMAGDKKKQRQENIISLLKQESLAYNQLASKLGYSVKTIRRDIAYLYESGHKITLKNKRLHLENMGIISEDIHEKVRLPSAVRLAFIIFLIQGNKGISFEKLKERLVREKLFDASAQDQDSIKDTVSKTLKNDLNQLATCGYIMEEKGCYYLGERMLKNITLNAYEISLIYYLIRQYGSLSPHKVELSSVLGKIIAFSPEKSFFNEALLEKRLKCFMVVGKIPGSSIQISRYIEKIEHAILYNMKVDIVYGMKLESAKFKTISPLGLCYNQPNDCWYIYILPLDREGNPQILRMDFILNLSLKESRFDPPENINLDSCVKTSWGISLHKPVNVRVRFEDIFNIEDKVRLYMENRPSAKLFKNDGYIEMEDEISGIDEFRHWLRQFGASAEVLEPQELRKYFFRTAKRMLDLYGIKH